MAQQERMFEDKTNRSCVFSPAFAQNIDGDEFAFAADRGFENILRTVRLGANHAADQIEQRALARARPPQYGGYGPAPNGEIVDRNACASVEGLRNVDEPNGRRK